MTLKKGNPKNPRLYFQVSNSTSFQEIQVKNIDYKIPRQK